MPLVRFFHVTWEDGDRDYGLFEAKHRVALRILPFCKTMEVEWLSRYKYCFYYRYHDTDTLAELKPEYECLTPSSIAFLSPVYQPTSSRRIQIFTTVIPSTMTEHAYVDVDLS